MSAGNLRGIKVLLISLLKQAFKYIYQPKKTIYIYKGIWCKGSTQHFDCCGIGSNPIILASHIILNNVAYLNLKERRR